MPENIFSDQQAATAERWLLPEVGSDRVVTSGSVKRDTPPLRRGGFSRRKYADDDSEISAAKPALRAMTASRLAELEASAHSRGFETGRSEGYQQGFAEGQEGARQLAASQLAEQRDCLNRLIESVGLEVSREQQQLKTTLSQLVVRMVQEVCMRELQYNSAIVKAVAQAVAALPIGERHIEIAVCPKDLELLRANPGVLRDEWQLKADQTIDSGGCKIKSEHSEVDFTVDQRIAQLVETVFKPEAIDD